MNISELLVNSSAKFRKEIIAMPVAALMDSALAHMTLRRGVAGDETVGAVGSGAEARPYKTAKGATDTSSIKARTLTTYLGDVLEEFDPYLLYTTVYGEAASDKTKRTDMEIVRDLSLAMGKSVSKKLGAAIFTASRNPDGTTTATLFNGFDTIAAAEITAGNISALKGNYMDVAAITAANVGDVLKSIFDGASEELQEADNLKMFVPKAVKLLYDEWFLAHFGAVNYNSSYGRKWLHGTDDHCEIVALSGQKNSPYIYLTTKNNMLVGCDQESNKERVLVRVPDNPKVVQFFMCFFWGVQFEMIEPEFLMVAKPASGSPSGETVISGDQLIEAPATSGYNDRTYSTSNGANVSAAVITEGASWLTVAATGNKVRFTRTAYAYDATNTQNTPRQATVRITAGTGHLDVVVKQAMATE